MSLLIHSSPYFYAGVVRGKGITHHFLLERKENATPGPGGHLGSREAVTELRETWLPAFLEKAGINNLTEKGFRLSVDIGLTRPPVVQLMAGPDVPAQCPQDWRSPSVVWAPFAPAAFFEQSAEAAKKGAATMPMPFGNRMLYSGERKDYLGTNFFGVVDGDPKAPTHFLVLAAESFGNILNLSNESLCRFFEAAFALCQRMETRAQPIKYVTNIGTGFQVGPRVHMHVLSSPGKLPSIFPTDYGFQVGKGGTITSPPASPEHDAVIDLIERRKQVKGFSPEAKAERGKIDLELMAKLEPLRREAEIGEWLC
jgi:diadenosine tetraphosphate (Ap4A) HIT family hydrolase